MTNIYDWILFDQGGTLFEPLPGHYSEANQRRALLELGADGLANKSDVRLVFAAARRAAEREFLTRTGYLHRELVTAHLLRGLVELGLCEPAILHGAVLPARVKTVVDCYCDRQAQTVVANLRLQKDCHTVLAELAEHYRLAVVSNNAENYLQPLLARCRLNQYLQGALASDTLGVCKPHPAIFARAFAKLGIPQNARSRVLYVGDTIEFDVASARAAGIDVALLSAGNIQAPAAVVVVATLSELARWLLSGARQDQP